MKNQKGLPRAKSRGFTFVELLIVIAIIGIIVAVAIPSLIRARGLTAVTSPFQTHFDVDLGEYRKPALPPDRWLDEEQKSILRPYVHKRLSELCAPSTERMPEVLKLSPVMDPLVVQMRLKTLDHERDTFKKESTSSACQEAREAASKLGLLEAEQSKQ